MTTTPAPIEVRKSRGFGDQINVTFAFLRENYKKLGKCVLYICGPLSVLAGILIGSNWIFGLMGTEDLESLSSIMGSLVWIWIGGLIGSIASILMIGVVNQYVFLYMERGYDGFEFEDVWEATRRSFGRIFLTMLGLGLIGIAIYALWIGVVLTVGVFGMLLGIVLIPVAFYLSVALSPIFTVRLYENAGVGEAISRSIELVKGHWLLTAGVLAVVYMVAGFFAGILAIPAYIIMMISMLNADSGGSFDTTGGYGLVVTIFMTLYMIVSYLVSAVPLLANVLHYFNLVEKHEGVGMMARIEQIGREDEPGGFGTPSF